MIADISADFNRRRVCIIRSNNDVENYDLTNPSVLLSHTPVDGATPPVPSDSREILKTCISALNHAQEVHTKQQLIIDELMEMRDGVRPLVSTAMTDVRKKLHTLWCTTRDVAAQEVVLDDPSVYNLISCELDRLLKRVRVHLQGGGGEQQQQQASPTPQTRSKPSYRKTSYTNYVITSIDYNGRNTNGNGMASFDVVRSCVDADVATVENKPVIQVDTVPFPLRSHGDVMTAQLGDDANIENHAIARLLSDAQRVWELEAAQQANGSCILKDVAGSWQHTEEKVGAMMTYIKAEIHKTEHNIKLLRLQEERAGGVTGTNASTSAGVRSLYSRLEELRGVESIVVQCTDLKASLQDTVHRQRLNMKKASSYKDDELKQRDQMVGTLHSVIATLRSQLNSLSQSLRDTRRQLTMRDTEAKIAIESAAQLVNNTNTFQQPSPQTAQSGVNNASSTNLNAMAGATPTKLPPAGRSPLYNPKANNSTSLLLSAIANERSTTPTLTTEEQERLIGRLYPKIQQTHENSGIPPKASRGGKGTNNGGKKLTVEEEEEVNTRLYYKAKENDKTVSHKLEQKYANIIQSRPTTAPLTKETLPTAMEKLYYNPVKHKGAFRAELFKKLVEEKEYHSPMRDQSEIEATVNRLYVKK